AEHYTPPGLVAAVADFFVEIDLDPCAEAGEPKTVPARQHYTAAEDGLTREWWGRVYINPPYGREIPRWIARAVASYETRECEAAILLLPSPTDTEWYRKLRDYPRCQINGRLIFAGNTDPAPFPSMLVYLGDELDRFTRAMMPLGDTFVRHEPGA